MQEIGLYLHDFLCETVHQDAHPSYSPHPLCPLYSLHLLNSLHGLHCLRLGKLTEVGPTVFWKMGWEVERGLGGLVLLLGGGRGLESGGVGGGGLIGEYRWFLHLAQTVFLLQLADSLLLQRDQLQILLHQPVSPLAVPTRRIALTSNNAHLAEHSFIISNIPSRKQPDLPFHTHPANNLCLYVDRENAVLIRGVVGVRSKSAGLLECELSVRFECELQQLLGLIRMINRGIDFLSGAVSGVTNCLSGFILDTVKVRMQVNPGAGMVETLVRIVKEEGFLTLFKGIYYPILTLPVVNSVVFTAYEAYKVARGKEQYSLIDGLESGAFAGLVVTTTVVTPMELIKCIMQNDRQGKFRHSRDCLREILGRDGFKGLYKGNVSTLFREIPGYATQFGAYEYLKQFYISRDHPHLTLAETLIVCPAAAMIGWVFSYPQDVIKTKIQVEPKDSYRSRFGDGGFWECGKEVYRRQGVAGFFVGISPCLIRACFSDGIGILTYQKSRQLLWGYRTH